MAWKFLARAAALSLSLLLIACGGDSGSTPLAGGSNNNGGDNGSGTPTTPGVTVGSIQLITSTPSIGSSGQDKAQITALVRDQNGILTPGLDVAFNAPITDP